MQRIVGITTIGLATLALAGPAGAHHPDDGVSPLLTATAHHQHGEVDGHLPAVQRNVELVGKLDLFGEEEQQGRIADVASFGDYAYLGAFASPNCEDPGVYVVDISNPGAPREADFIPTSDPSSFVGEGVQILDMNTEFFQGPVLIYNNETCLPFGNPVLGDDPRLGLGGPGGATLVDVRDPENWTKLSDHVGDNDPPPPGGLPFGFPHNTHSAFGWQQDDKAYLVAVDNGEGGETDIDIFDITNPADPVMVAETGMTDFPQVSEDPPPNGNNAFLHDMVVKKVGERYLMLASYWDGGYIVLDVTNLPEKPTFVGDTDFGAVEPFAAQMGLPADWTPEGNGHQAEFNHDNTMFLGADEDFGARRVMGRVTTGTYAGDMFSATQGSNVPQIDDDTSVAGDTDFVGQACTPLPPVPEEENRVALTERGTCTFTIKTQNIQAAGYDAGIVFNDQATDPDCDAQVFMLAVGDIPFVFTGRSAGLKLLDVSFEDPCATPTPVAADGQGVDMSAVFDGWGYMHLYDANTMEVIDHWALPESLDPMKASGSGDLSIHEVATDPTANRAYVSHYSGGFRVFDFSRKKGIQEVGAYIAEGGNNFWGVEVHPQAGSTTPLVLASDRDSGLWIFRYTGDRTKRGGGKQR
jgi:hypothetical protein